MWEGLAPIWGLVKESAEASGTCILALLLHLEDHVQLAIDFFKQPAMMTARTPRGLTHYLQEAKVMPKGATRLATKCRPMRSVPAGDEVTEDWAKVDCKECLKRRYYD